MSATTANPSEGNSAGAVMAAASQSPLRLAVRRFAGRPAAVMGLVVVALFVLAAVLAPLISPYDPIATSWSLIR
jgi:peptide/nickel transport system permease protein